MIWKTFLTAVFVVVLSSVPNTEGNRTSSPVLAEIEHAHTALLVALEGVKDDLKKNGSPEKW
jgi:hypothetical protein